MAKKPEDIKFIEEQYDKYRLMKYLEKKLDRAGLANVDVQRTPQLTRILLEVLNPAKIIGKGGRLINELTEDIRHDFGIKNPQISVAEVSQPALEPKLIAKRTARYIEMGKKVRAVLHFFLRDMIRAGALGAEIVASGKIGAKGARAKSLRVGTGYLPKAGEPARLIKVAHINANTKSGVIGVLVRIALPGTIFPDKAGKIKAVPLPKVIESAESPEEMAAKRAAEEEKGAR